MHKYFAILLLLLASIGSAAQAKKPTKTQSVGREVVIAKDAPKAVGPYSQGIKTDGFVYTAGQLPLDPATGQLAGNDVATQTDRVLKNIAAVLNAAGTSMDRVIKATVFLKNMSDFNAMNEVYGRYFKEDPPARSTIGVNGLARDALVEIEVVALAK
ncbi:MAG: RidA family protein [Terriglobales bacterium]